MLINADFTRRATLTPQQYQWLASPQAGVERVMLDRIGAEKARATSIVRYAPNSHFPRHLHAGGEEILVLVGTFSDETADYPAGWYLRNPPGSSHQPSSRTGAVIFVKLQQMLAHEHRHVTVDTGDDANWHREGEREICPLFSDASEQVYLQRLQPRQILDADLSGGLEMLVQFGSVTADAQCYEAGSWLRMPAGDTLAIMGGGIGATVYLKTGHLADHLVVP